MFLAFTFEKTIRFSVLFREGPPIIRQFKHGQSNPTYYIEYGGARLVLRKKPVCTTVTRLVNLYIYNQCLERTIYSATR